MTSSHHLYEVRPRKDKRGVDLISDVLPFESPVVWRAKRSQQRNRLPKVLQSFTRCARARVLRLHRIGTQQRNKPRYSRPL